MAGQQLALFGAAPSPADTAPQRPYARCWTCRAALPRVALTVCGGCGELVCAGCGTHWRNRESDHHRHRIAWLSRWRRGR